MPVPSSVTDLDPVASNNSPAGSEPIGPDLDAYLRSHAAIIRQVSDSSKTDVQTHAATSKATPVDADELPLADSAASFGLKKLTWANLKAAIKTYLQAGMTMTGLLKFAAGANIASAATVDLTAATGNTVHITGTTTITGWTLSTGQFMNVIFDGVLQLTHNATANNLPGAANITTAAGDRALLSYDGTTVYLFAYQRADGTALVASSTAATNSGVRLNNGNGAGSTNTKIRRFTTTVTNNGSDITYTDSAANGASFTVNNAGNYAISYTDYSTSSAVNFGITLNDNQGTTNIESTTAANILAMCSTSGTGVPNGIAWAGYLPAGSVITAKCNAGGATTAQSTLFSMFRVDK